MTTQEAIAYINAHTWSQWKLGLERVTELLARLGDPQKQLRFVHVAGSNGKGSCCAMLERVLREAGYTTGFFPSPYLEDFRERIQVNGEWIPEEALTRITERVRIEADAMEDHPSQFELVTAIGMLYFLEVGCDIVVLEVGLGGAYDATNVIDAPEVAVLMNIGLEHTEYLGNTLTEIAETKCGIIKPGCAVVAYPSEEEALDVIRRIASEKDCPLEVVDLSRMQEVENTLDGQVFTWDDSDSVRDIRNARGIRDARENQRESYRLSLLGRHQLRNAATVLTVIEALRERGWEILMEAVHAGLANVVWPARFEVLSRDPLFVLDGGHNPQCAEALAEALDLYLPDQKVLFLIGMLGDKDVDRVLEILLPYAAEAVCVTPNSERALPAEDLAQRIREKGTKAETVAVVSEGVETILKAGREGLPVIAFGSLYMAGEIRRHIKNDSK